MSAPAAFQATYSDWKLIRTRKVVQIVFEVPIEKADEAYQVVGGMPDNSAERWFAIARLNPEVGIPTTPKPAKERKPFETLKASQQAGILCETEAFHKYLIEIGRCDADGDVAEAVRQFCRVNSRSELDSNPRALVEWKRLEVGYRQWLTDPVP